MYYRSVVRLHDLLSNRWKAQDNSTRKLDDMTDDVTSFQRLETVFESSNSFLLGNETKSFIAWMEFLKQLHPGRLTWNLQITHLERKMIFQTWSMLIF